MIEGTGGVGGSAPRGLVTLAAVCKRGHVINLDAGRVPDPGEPSGFCETCGARIVRACRSCEAPLLGVSPSADAYGNLDTEEWRRPDFCRDCGSPYPWVDRAGRIQHLENLLDNENLDEATDLAVREQLNALADPDVDDKSAQRRWNRVRDLAPGLWEQSGARAVLTSLMTEALKREFGLGPD
jgi:hypothetical protein